MPGKTRRKKGKHSAQGKRKVDGSRQAVTLSQQPAAAKGNEPVSSTKMSPPSASVPAPAAKPQGVRYPYISAELRTISILAVIMLVILVVLASVPLPW
ncbi:hypothetical protein ACFLXO_02480 [Chloroflexota bacterium]